MQSLPLTAKGAASEYLRSLHALASEILAAMDAIAANSPERIASSVSMQEMLCMEATAMAHALMELAKVDPTLIDSAIKQEIKEKQEYVGGLMQRYRALMAHSGQTIAQLSNLCRSYGGATAGSGYPGTARRTWSCEV